MPVTDFLSSAMETSTLHFPEQPPEEPNGTVQIDDLVLPEKVSVLCSVMGRPSHVTLFTETPDSVDTATTATEFA